MMTTEARVAAVKERVRAKEQQKLLRLAAGVLIAAAFLAGIALARRRSAAGEVEEWIKQYALKLRGRSLNSLENMMNAPKNIWRITER